MCRKDPAQIYSAHIKGLLLSEGKSGKEEILISLLERSDTGAHMLHTHRNTNLHTDKGGSGIHNNSGSLQGEQPGD